MIAQLDWNEVGALVGIASLVLTAIIVPFSKWIIREVRKTQTTADDINRRVTTPATVPGTIGQTVAKLAIASEAHEKVDDARFEEVWKELGKSEPQP